MICQTCKEHTNTRPYGVNGAPICFVCAMSTPESIVETAKQFQERFELVKSMGLGVKFGDETGPMPAGIPDAT